MKYILINEIVETPSGFDTAEAIMRITSYNQSTNINNEDVASTTTYAQTSAWKSLIDFQEGKQSIAVTGMTTSFNFQGDMDIDALYDAVAESLITSGFDALVQDTVPV